ncbi:MAG TPA: hypothetical protein P5038_09600, partial [Candidatus Paceibacterota bacterium]|nr:hypothetical protein [Candidatus Paceibacterota bacterium]
MNTPTGLASGNKKPATAVHAQRSSSKPQNNSIKITKYKDSVYGNEKKNAAGKASIKINECRLTAAPQCRPTRR